MADEPTSSSGSARRGTGPLSSVTSRLQANLQTHLRNIRHELRTPLNQIIGYSELLAEEAEDAGQEDFLPDLERIRSAANHMLGLLDDIFAVDSGSPAVARRGLAVPQAPSVRPPETKPEPRPEAEAGAEDAGAERASSLTSIGGHLLVVDDNELNRDMLARRLRKKGYTVDVAEDGLKALDLIEKGSFDLILLDIMMPGISGLEVLQRLRQIYTPTELPVIMATAMDDSKDVVNALKLGANDYVTKPIDLPVVLARTEAQLTVKHGAEEIGRLAQQLELRNAFLRKTFGRFLSDDIVHSLLATPEALHLGGEKRRVTILMSDLRGFSGLSERLEPENVVSLLNNYLGVMAGIIARHGGTIDEFIGDAILAIFGAPIQREDDAQRAVACSVEMQLAMEKVNAWNREHGLPAVEMGIGIHTSEVIVGNIGSRQRMKYAVVGSAVNLTSRIESYTIGGQILTSEDTLDRVQVPVRIDGSLEVMPKGISHPLRIFSIGGVGAPYELSLPIEQEDYRQLASPVSLRCVALEGKHLAADTFGGELLHLGQRGALARFEQAVPGLSNLRLSVLGGHGEEVPGEVYAKVMVGDPDEQGCVPLVFTSVPPEVASFLEQARQQMLAG